MCFTYLHRPFLNKHNWIKTWMMIHTLFFSAAQEISSVIMLHHCQTSEISIWPDVKYGHKLFCSWAVVLKNGQKSSFLQNIIRAEYQAKKSYETWDHYSRVIISTMSLMTNEDRRFDSGAVPASDVSRFNLMSVPVLSDWEWRAELALIRALCALPDQIVHAEQKFSLIVLYAVGLEISQTPQSSSSSHSLSVFCLLCRCSWRNVSLIDWITVTLQQQQPLSGATAG